MKVILDIKKERFPFFMELVKSLDYVAVIKEVKDEQKGRVIEELAESFYNVKLHEAGKKKLKTARQLLNEI